MLLHHGWRRPFFYKLWGAPGASSMRPTPAWSMESGQTAACEVQMHPQSHGTGADEVLPSCSVPEAGVLLVGKCLPRSGEDLCCPIGLVSTLKSDTTAGCRCCPWCGTLDPECFLCQLGFPAPPVPAVLVPHPAD